MTLKINYNSVVLFVKDISVSKKFYVELLKQEIEHDFKTNIIFTGGLAIWQIKPEHPIADKLVKSPQQENHTKEIYFETEDLDEIARLLRENDVKLFHDIIEEAWGQRTIRFFDPDNHLIEVGESLACFIHRLSKDMLIEEVSEKTGVEISKIQSILNG